MRDVDGVAEEAKARRRAKKLHQRSSLVRWGEDRPGSTDVRPPAQPADGPGGRDYRHASVRYRIYGEGTTAYWLFKPADPVPSLAPLVLFFRGHGSGRPMHHASWIEHLVRRGNIVLFPTYRPSGEKAPFEQLLRNMVALVKDSLREQASHAARPDLDRVAVVGHSYGGILGAHFVATAQDEGLPSPKVLMSVLPAEGAALRAPAEALGGIRPGTLLLVVVAEDDRIARDTGGRAIYLGARQVPTEDRNLVVLRSDYHGTPPLVANHRSPAAERPSTWLPPGRPAREDARHSDALNFYGYWKFLDGLSDAAFLGHHRIYALGDTPQQRFMGLWSDGTPVREPRVVTDPAMLLLELRQGRQRGSHGVRSLSGPAETA